MALSNRDRVGQVMDQLKAGMEPYVRRRLDAELGPNWAQSYATTTTVAPRPLVSGGRRPTGAEAVAAGKARESREFLDIAGLLKAVRDNWNASFAPELGKLLQSVVHELLEWRNQWAHQAEFGTEDVLRVMDSAKRLLEAVSAGEQAQAIEQQRRDLLQLQTKEQGRAEFRKVQLDLIKAPEGVSDKLEGWRQVITPRQDVREGSFELAGYAADLWEVYRSAATKEYGDPIEFFARTYLTTGLRELLVQAVQRLTKTGGAPVIQLQTNFGGGKTHSMLALWHLTGGTDAARLPGVETALLEPLKLKEFPKVKRAVFVGTKRGPAEVVTPEKGVEIHTLWGELAYQLLGKKGYELVAESDRKGVNPGGGLKALLEAASPCLIMIDEWVAYARQLSDEPGLPAGTIGAQLTFAQSLTEAASTTPGVLLIVSVPESDMEVGGPAGAQVLEKLRHHIGRVETSWRPADRAESFEIVRRRLFEELPSEQIRKRDAVCMAYAETYRKYTGDFPAVCRDKGYEDELKLAYPIHPEMFTRLYEDWATIDKFQRTRGVLRLMAIVVHHLWRGDDGNLLIMPGTLPLDIDAVQNELTRYLEENWRPVIDQEIAGPQSRAQSLENDLPQFAKVGAARKVARTIFLGSAPLQKTANKGVEDQRIKLGVVQPGENPAVYGDALRRLSDTGVHLYSSANKYWYGLQATINRLAAERAERHLRDTEALEMEQASRVKELFRDRGKWPRISVCPRDPAEVGDEVEARLVVLAPEQWYDPKQPDQSPAQAMVQRLLDERASGPRRHRNVLFFQVPVRAHLDKLNEKTASYLAWRSIDEDITSGSLEVEGQQRKQAKDKLAEALGTLLASLPELYGYVLYPTINAKPGSKVVWEGQKLSLSRDSSPAVEAFRKLQQVEAVIENLGATILKMQLDRIPLWERGAEHIEIRKLAELFPLHLYMPKLVSPAVLERAIASGLEGLQINPDTFAFAESYDAEKGRYVGLVEGRLPNISLDGAGLLVKPNVARAQLDAEYAAQAAARAAREAQESGRVPEAAVAVVGAPGDPSLQRQPAHYDLEPAPPTQPVRFHGSVLLDPLRVGSQASKVADEVISHLSKQVGATVEVRLEIQATYPDGYPDDVQRTVSENARTLKFTENGFELS